MADKKISELTAVTSLAHSDAFPLYDASATATRKATLSTLFGGAYFPNASATDQGATGNSDTIKYAVDTISSDSGMVVLRNDSGSATTTYTFSTNETIPANIILEIENGAFISVDTGKTLTIYSPANIKASPTQQIFTGSGTVAFSSGSGNIYPEWWQANTTPGTTDMTAAITKAFAAAPSVTNQPVGNYYIGSSTPIVFQATKYLMSEDVAEDNPYMTVKGDQTMVIQSVSSENIFDFTAGHHVRIEGIKFVGGANQVRIGNTNLSRGTFYLTDVGFHGSGEFALETYMTGGATNLSSAMNLVNVDFQECQQAIYNAAGMMTHWNGGWLGFAYVVMGDTAQIVNYADFHMFNVTGGPNITQSAAGRWVDNYAYFQAKDTRFGGEGDGMPIVYQYALAVNASSRLGGAVVDIQSCLMAAGGALVNQKVLHLVDGVPQKIIIKNNDTTRLQNLELITIEGGFDLAAYINALNYQTRIFIDIGIENAANPPFSAISLPDDLINTDHNKVILSDETRVHIYGLRQALLHFDNPKADPSYVPNEYTKAAAEWALINATISTTTPRFGRSCLNLGAATQYLVNTGITDIGDAFTFEFWFRVGNAALNANIFRAVNADGYGIAIYYTGASTQKLALYASSDGASYDISNGTEGALTPLVAATWYKAVIEFTGTRYSVYVGTAGTAVTEDIGVASTDSICAITNIRLGHSATGLVGAIDEFRMLLDDYRYGAIFIPEAEPFRVN